MKALETHLSNKFKKKIGSFTFPTLGFDFSKLINNLQFSDIKFLVKGKEFYASKAILSVRGSYFKSLFSGTWKEFTDKTLEVTQVDPTYFERMLKFLYTDFIEIENSTEAHEFLALADFYNLAGIRTACEKFFISAVEIDSVIEIWNISINSGSILTDLYNYCLRFFTENFYVCSASPGFLKMDIRLLKQALDFGNINFSSENLMDVIIRWGQNNRPSDVDLLTFINDLLPPRTVFNRETKMFLLGELEVLFP